MSEFETVAAALTLSLEGTAVGTIANNLTTEVEGYFVTMVLTTSLTDFNFTDFITSLEGSSLQHFPQD